MRWTPDSDDAAIDVRAVVGSTEADLPDVSGADGVEPPDDDTLRAEFADELLDIGIDINRVKDNYKGRLSRGFRLFARKEKLAYHGDTAQKEWERINQLWQDWFTKATTRAEIWQDIDQDDVRDEGEDSTLMPWGSYERGPI